MADSLKVDQGVLVRESVITPACRADAGSATERVELMGAKSVITTPRPKTANRISIKSGFLFTIFSFLLVFQAAVFGGVEKLNAIFW